jgi:hypothetical protein
MQRTQTSTASDMLRRLCHWKQVLKIQQCVFAYQWLPGGLLVRKLLVSYCIQLLDYQATQIQCLFCHVPFASLKCDPVKTMNVENNKLTLWFSDHHCYIGIIKILSQASEILYLSRRNRHQENKNFHLQALHRNHTPVFCVLFIPATPDDSPVTVCHT